MEKLIELLNEFNKEKWWHPWLLYEWFWVRKWDLNFIFNHSKFPFIKWLVDNDKIDIEKVIDTAKSFWIDTYNYEEGIDDIYIPLLMVLAVEDTPIEYLLSVIK